MMSDAFSSGAWRYIFELNEKGPSPQPSPREQGERGTRVAGGEGQQMQSAGQPK
jgi:hypothetical protein